MKKNISIIHILLKSVTLVSLLLILSSSSLFARTAIKYEYHLVEAGTGSSYEWCDNGFTMCFASDVKNCKVYVTYDDGDVETLPLAGGFHIKIRLKDILYENVDTNQMGYSKPAGFKFLEGFDFHIYECNQYPELNGISVMIDGSVVDENGDLNIFIPNGAY